METTNFFSKVAALELTGDLQLTISKGKEGNWIVSVLVRNEQCGDDARKLIPPLNLKGSPEDLDNGFFQQITVPVKAASGLMVQMEGFMKQLEQAKKSSAIEKEKADKERKQKEVKEKKYKDAMQKVEELEKEEKYRDAWMKMPEPAEYPEQADAIRKRKSDLARKFAPDLFDAPDTKEEESTQQCEDILIHKNASDTESPDEAIGSDEDDVPAEAL